MSTLREKYLQNIQDTYEQALELVYTKSQDYATNDDPFKNFRDAALFAGITLEQGILVRIGDKFARVRNLLEKGENSGAVGEAITDTLNDACNYTAILKTWIDLKRPTPDSEQLELPFDTDSDPGDENSSVAVGDGFGGQEYQGTVTQGSGVWLANTPSPRELGDKNWYEKLFGL